MKFFDRIKNILLGIPKVPELALKRIPPTPAELGPLEDETGEEYRARVRKREAIASRAYIAQQIWNDTVSEIVENPDMEEPFKKFVRQHIGEWASSVEMDTDDVKKMIKWIILKSNNYIIHDDISRILERIYEAMLPGSIH